MTAASLPPHMIASAPFSAPAWPPDTGASTTLRPRASPSSARRRASRADAVVWSTKSAPAAIAPNAPSAPIVTSSTSRSAPTQAITASAPAAASAALAAALPPCASTQARAFSGLRLWTVRSCPAAAR
jgi:hypothetical protein